MEHIQALLKKYPNRIKYGILILDIFAMIIAIKTYVNYVSIETAIENATIEQQMKTDELAFTQNFLVNYEKSEYAKYFLEHENNMLQGDEYIIKFEEMYQKQQSNT
jgi:type III secretory pathway component EscR